MKIHFQCTGKNGPFLPLLLQWNNVSLLHFTQFSKYFTWNCVAGLCISSVSIKSKDGLCTNLVSLIPAVTREEQMEFPINQEKP